MFDYFRWFLIPRESLDYDRDTRHTETIELFDCFLSIVPITIEIENIIRITYFDEFYYTRCVGHTTILYFLE